MPKTRVVDLSHHNVIPQSLEPAAAAGVWAVIHKLTEGQSYTDPKVDARYVLTQKAGMLWGLYHFIRPGRIEEQAQFFVRQSDTLEVTDDATLYALDYEDAGVSLNDALMFMRVVEDLTGRQPVLYSGHVLKEALGGKPNAEISKYRLWLAQYSSAPTLPIGFDHYWLWQFSESGNVPGINPPVDLNAYDGDQDALVAEWAGDTTPAPTPEPGELVVTIDITAPPGVKVVVHTS